MSVHDATAPAVILRTPDRPTAPGGRSWTGEHLLPHPASRPLQRGHTLGTAVAIWAASFLAGVVGAMLLPAPSEPMPAGFRSAVEVDAGAQAGGTATTVPDPSAVAPTDPSATPATSLIGASTAAGTQAGGPPAGTQSGPRSDDGSDRDPGSRGRGHGRGHD